MPTTLPALLALALAQAQTGTPVPEAGAPPAAEETPAAGSVAEGQASQIPTRRYLIERVEVRGLSHTRLEALHRHLLVDEGEILDPERVLLSRLSLLQLGWFSSVDTHVERGSERGKVVVVFDVVERNTLVVTDLVLGSTRPQPLYGGLGLSQQNFLGEGLGLSGGFVYGGTPEGRAHDPNRYALRAGFFAPDLAVPRLRLVAGVSGLFLRGEELACADVQCTAFQSNYGEAPRIRYLRAGGEVLLGVRPGPFERLSGAYRLERVHATRIGVSPGAGPAVHDGWSELAALTGSYEVETRDDFFYPTDGFHANGQVTFASRLFGGDYEFSRYLLQLDTAYDFLRLPLRIQAALGAVQGDAPFFERFYPADYSYFAIGPALGRAMELNFSTDSRYDAFLAMGGLEWGIPLWTREDSPWHRGYLAVGLRAVWSSATLGGGRTDFSKTPISADLALRLDTIIGTFNLSLGYALDNAL
ncbi:MAG TPA: BamA/TamA family outer membrane protein [Anaeromyxobacter sp.]|nr:BamA/TamA family outer membrane protein [Anaeromyxobacter sp.]